MLIQSLAETASGVSMIYTDLPVVLDGDTEDKLTVRLTIMPTTNLTETQR